MRPNRTAKIKLDIRQVVLELGLDMEKAEAAIRGDAPVENKDNKVSNK